MNCEYCGKKFTCGCQKVKLSTGVVVCKGCNRKEAGRKSFEASKKRLGQKVRKNERRWSENN